MNTVNEVRESINWFISSYTKEQATYLKKREEINEKIKSCRSIAYTVPHLTDLIVTIRELKNFTGLLEKMTSVLQQFDDLPNDDERLLYYNNYLSGRLLP